MNPEYKLYFQNVSKIFPGVVALDDVTFGIKPGCVHVIMGENGAGKSTLMKIINGSHEPSGGKVFLDGREVKFASTQESMKNGIGMVYQELSYIPDFTVERYLEIGREPMKGPFINWKQLSRNAKEILEKEGLNYDQKALLRTLSVAELQLLEIAKVISENNADIIILDEPTSALSDSEVDYLFDKIRELKARGITILYISHKMDEIFRIADYITVMRDGMHIHTGPRDEFTIDSLVTMMVGRELKNVYPKEDVPLGDVILEVKNLASDYNGIHDVSFHVRKCEILGLAGLMGAGRTETVRALFGLDPISKGEIWLEGKQLKIKSVSDAAKSGIAMATEDRRRYGLIPCRSIRENVAIANLKKLSKGVFIDHSLERTEVKKFSDKLRIKAPNLEVPTSTLSGGNQQKVVLAKWLLSNPKILILDEPTRGIDIGAKYEIYKLMTEMVKAGITIILISSELPEFIGMCDRAYTMYNGTITGELQRDELTQEKIMMLSTGGHNA